MTGPINDNELTDLDDEDKRISRQVTTMSTQLVESICTRSELEAKLNQLTDTTALLQRDADKYMALKQDYETLQGNLNTTNEQIDTYKTAL